MKQSESPPLIDVVESVGYGYRFLRQEHSYLMKIAVVPLAIKMICLLLLVGLGWDRDFIRSALVMLPADFAEGWMLAHLIRLVFYDQRWPFQPTGDREQDRAILQDRIFGVTGGALFYVLIKFLLAGLMAFLAHVQALVVQTEPIVQGEPSRMAVVVALLILMTTLWSFRFVFLYIPASAGLSVRPLILHRRGFLISIQMLGVWLVSFVPFAMILLLLTSGLVGEGETISMANRFVVIIIQAVCDTAIAIVSTTAIAMGLRKMIENRAMSV